MTMEDFFSWLLKEEIELEEILYSRDNNMDTDEYQIKQGRLEEVRRIRRKLQSGGVLK